LSMAAFAQDCMANTDGDIYCLVLCKEYLSIHDLEQECEIRAPFWSMGIAI
jgi:hypothetical protein